MGSHLHREATLEGSERRDLHFRGSSVSLEEMLGQEGPARPPGGTAPVQAAEGRWAGRGGGAERPANWVEGIDRSPDLWFMCTDRRWHKSQEARGVPRPAACRWAVPHGVGMQPAHYGHCRAAAFTARPMRSPRGTPEKGAERCPRGRWGAECGGGCSAAAQPGHAPPGPPCGRPSSGGVQ